MGGLSGTAQGAAGAIQGSFDGLSGAIFGAMNQIIGSVTNGFNTAKSNAISACNELVSQAGNIFNNIGDFAYWAGVHIGEGLANGMRSQLENVARAAQDLVNQADRAVKAKAEIASPSKLFRREGRYMGEGMELGILDKIKSVRNAATKLVKAPEGITYNPALSSNSVNAVSLDKNTIVNAIKTAMRNENVGNTTNVYVDGAIVNDDAQMRSVTEQFIKQYTQRKGMVVANG